MWFASAYAAEHIGDVREKQGVFTGGPALEDASVARLIYLHVLQTASPRRAKRRPNISSHVTYNTFAVESNKPANSAKIEPSQAIFAFVADRRFLIKAPIRCLTAYGIGFGKFDPAVKPSTVVENVLPSETSSYTSPVGMPVASHSAGVSQPLCELGLVETKK